ncbi:VrrA/YqfQ family protein [Bacillus sp. B-jedd]|uniref:VrrA/YqfQ family protein n=1 Tax=Bacillus sp. B-jedd TaxID=1476857 RepID=UPI00051562DB|nr:VrrA/YqfQ family protein [Bacillus sp. B-jedd]CEG27888.1 YqfQ protein [Bacillus sp. B-jedd]
MPPMPQMPMPRPGGFGRQPMAPRFARQSGFPAPPRGPNMGPMNMMQPQQPSRGGGLLARLLGGAGRNQGIASTTRAATQGQTGAGSVLKSLGNPDTINTFLANTQNVINTAQKFGPLIEQYGPLIKNLPSMWKLYRGIKASDSQSEEATETKKNEKPAGGQEIDKRRKNRNTSSQEKSTDNLEQDGTESAEENTSIRNRSKREGKGESRPKLFF